MKTDAFQKYLLLAIGILFIVLAVTGGDEATWSRVVGIVAGVGLVFLGLQKFRSTS